MGLSRNCRADGDGGKGERKQGAEHRAAPELREGDRRVGLGDALCVGNEDAQSKEQEDSRGNGRHQDQLERDGASNTVQQGAVILHPKS